MNICPVCKDEDMEVPDAVRYDTDGCAYYEIARKLCPRCADIKMKHADLYKWVQDVIRANPGPTGPPGMMGMDGLPGRNYEAGWSPTGPAFVIPSQLPDDEFPARSSARN